MPVVVVVETLLQEEHRAVLEEAETEVVQIPEPTIWAVVVVVFHPVEALEVLA
jgi:hypothetical protein